MTLKAHVFFTLLLFVMVAGETFHPLSDEFINEINSKQTLWKAGRNFPADTPLSYIKKLMGTILNSNLQTNLYVMEHSPELIASLPENFDLRDKWPNCPTLNEIRDQGACGSCWAFGAVEAMTDRVCIYSNGTQNFHFSADDLVSCSLSNSGCSGGMALNAWEYWVKNGIVSGGAYNSSEGCRPYEIPPCNHYSPDPSTLPPCDHEYPTPSCVDTCITGSNIDYKKDKHYGKRVYCIQNEDNIKAELFANGPVEADFQIYSDFLSYKSGVYKHVTGDYHGGHSIKILGWGVENGTKYWLAANSWNSGWGDKGFFKILRGENECHIESSIVAGEPVLDNN